MRRERESLEKVCLNLFQGDMERLKELHVKEGATRMIREIIRAHIRDTEARMAGGPHV